MSNHAEKSKTASLDVWLMLDEHGNYVVSPNERALTNLWRDQIGTEPVNRRTVRLTLVVELPYGAHMTSELAETTIMQVLHERGYHRSSTRDAISIRNRC
jgi:hypothetical protein